MGILSRTIFLEITGSALLGALLFVFVLFLQKAGQLFSILVSSTTTRSRWIPLPALPATMPLTIPLGTLVGVLICLSRMSSDGEITAMRASGIPGSAGDAAGDGLPCSRRNHRVLLAEADPWCNAELITW